MQCIAIVYNTKQWRTIWILYTTQCSTLRGLLYSDCPPLFCIIYYRDTLCGLLYSECPPLFCIIYYRDTVCGLLYSFIGTGYLLHVIVISGSMRQSTGYLLHVIVISGSMRQSTGYLLHVIVITVNQFQQRSNVAWCQQLSSIQKIAVLGMLNLEYFKQTLSYRVVNIAQLK
jgi:hypothetical protein